MSFVWVCAWNKIVCGGEGMNFSHYFFSSIKWVGSLLLIALGVLLVHDSFSVNNIFMGTEVFKFVAGFLSLFVGIIINQLSLEKREVKS